MLRWLPVVLVIWPKLVPVDVLKPVFGLAQRTELVTLNASTRNSAYLLPVIWKRLKSDPSSCQKPGPSGPLWRFMLPCTPAAGSEYTVGSKYSLPGPRPPSTVLAPVRLTKAELPGVLISVVLPPMDSACPDCASNRPLPCHPPSTWLRTP